MTRNEVFDALGIELPLEPAPVSETVAGEPLQGFVELGALPGAGGAEPGTEVGVWELRNGVTTDIEVDEFFVVLAGSAMIETLDEAGETVQSFNVQAGTVMRLVAGTKTRWHVPNFVRKVYIS